MVVVGHRLLTFFALASLAATMMMVTRYNLITEEAAHSLRKQISIKHAAVLLNTQQLLASANSKPPTSAALAATGPKSVGQDDHIGKNSYLKSYEALKKSSVDYRWQDARRQSDIPSVNQDAAVVVSRPTSALRSPNLVSSSTSLPSPSSQSALAAVAKSPEAAAAQDQSTVSSGTSSKGAVVDAAKSINLNDSAVAPANATAATKPKIVFSSTDLEATKYFLINKPQYCDEDNGATLDLLVVVTSAVDHFEAREAIRNTWGAFAVERGAPLLFLLGATRDEAVQARVQSEEQQYGDILQGAFIDNYYNLTLKTISLMRWVNATCNQIRYVLKVDDDMFVNMMMVVDFCETRTFNKAIIGKLARKWAPHRDPKSKWYVPTSAFNGTLYPNFATGPAYMFSGDATQALLETSLRLTPIYLEDVYMTGIVAERANIRRLNHALMKNVRLRVDSCTFKRFITSHKHTPKEIVSLWKQVYESTKACNETKVTKPATTSDKKPVAAAGAPPSAAQATSNTANSQKLQSAQPAKS